MIIMHNSPCQDARSVLVAVAYYRQPLRYTLFSTVGDLGGHVLTSKSIVSTYSLAISRMSGGACGILRSLICVNKTAFLQQINADIL